MAARHLTHQNQCLQRATLSQVRARRKQGAESIEKADKNKDISGPAYLDELQSIVDRLDKLEKGIKTDEEAAPVQKLANGFAKILEEQSAGQAISVSTGKMFADAAKDLSLTCIASLRGN